MEIYGILFSVPVAFFLSTVYCAFLAKVVHRFDRLRRFLFAASLVVLGLFLVELTLLASFGAVQIRTTVGPTFYVAHLVLFVLGVPALANTLILRRNGPQVGRRSTAVVACTVFAFFLALMQYGVTEAFVRCRRNQRAV